MIKLKEILKYICDDVHTRVCIVYNFNGKQIDLVYAGPFKDIPWSLTENELVEPSEDEESYALDFCNILAPVPKAWDTGLVEDSNWDDRPGLYIYIKE